MKKLFTVSLLLVALTFCSCDTLSTTTNNNLPNTTVEENIENDSTTSEKLLLENNDIKVSFVEIFETPELPGTCYLRLNIQNKTAKTVMVSIQNSYVNDMTQMMGTGVPIILEPDKNSQQPFFFAYTNLGISTKDEIKKIEFKVWLMDNDTYDTVVETEALTIDLSK